MQKKIPMRMCLGCGERQPKRDLIRIVRTTEGEFKIDETGKINGRGCYVCRKVACMDAIIKQKKLARSFEENVESEVYTKLKDEFNTVVN